MYTHCVFSGEFQVVNPWLLKELIECKLRDETMRNIAIAHGGKLLVTCSDCSLTFMWLGSVQHIPNIPINIKAIYKTVWEISQKRILILNYCGMFICQSQSLNVHMQSPTVSQLVHHGDRRRRALRLACTHFHHPLMFLLMITLPWYSKFRNLLVSDSMHSLGSIWQGFLGSIDMGTSYFSNGQLYIDLCPLYYIHEHTRNILVTELKLMC